MKASLLAELLRGVLTGEDSEIVGFATDSREGGPGKAFLAIRGANVDGHDFVVQANASVSVVERPVEGPYILVPNLVDALAHMGGALRDGFEGPVIAITGSAGKTTTKEMIASALSPLGPVLSTVGNRNSEYTSPLLWADLTPETRAVVVEMGMRGFGQISHLARFVRPTVAVITNIGWSHLEQMGDREGIARAKAEIFEGVAADGLCVWWAEDDFSSALAEAAGNRPHATFGFEAGDSRVTHYEMRSWTEAVAEGVTDGREWSIPLPVIGRHIAINAAVAILIAHRSGVPVAEAAAAVSRAKLPPMRMEVRERGGVTLLVDAYNAAPNSMQAAIDTLADAPVVGRKLAVLGEMRELGTFTESTHLAVGESLRSAGVADACFFGGTAELYRKGFGGGRIASDISEVRAFVAEAGAGDAVLLKGSRSLALERALEDA
ncbi:UDP-N-acetylmuramoyl-tripeptide--D-alanyl-D-alanine ligase [bacterium]|nr:MAG: UDP-N-acetylmuramoyl-tripeptide--D-alanyl-D-alanine ligase [bacterium]